MLVLTATNELQGSVDGDYAHTVEGELVTPVVAACSDVRCGCDRGFPGLASARATTTAMVVDLPHVTGADLRDAVHESLVRGGWLDLLREAASADDAGDDGHGADPEAELHDIVDEHVDAIAAVCAAFPVGTVVGRHGPQVVARSLPTAA
jgi:hypothetical protein